MGWRYLDPRVGAGKSPLWLPPIQGTITRPYGASERWLKTEYYRGMDITGLPHAEALAPGAGRVVYAGDRADGLGITVELTSSDGRYLYGLHRLGSIAPGIVPGAVVRAQQQLGRADSQGRLIFSVRTSKEDGGQLERWDALAPARRKPSIVKAWLSEQISDAQLDAWLTTVERGGESWIESDPGVTATSVRAVEQGVTALEEAAEAAANAARDSLSSPEVVGFGMVAGFVLIGGIVWVVTRR